MENTKQVTTNSYQPTSDHVDYLKNAVSSIVAAMTADYGASFKNTFTSDEEIRQLKRRLYAKLRGLPVNCIIEGYENCVANNTKFCPTVPEIVGSVLAVVREKKKHARLDAEAASRSALPAPTKTADVMGMLAAAKATADARGPESREERQARLASLEQNHNAVLALHGRNIHRRVMADHHQCAYGGCRKFGSLSNSTRGDGNFYCGEHWRP